MWSPTRDPTRSPTRDPTRSPTRDPTRSPTRDPMSPEPRCSTRSPTRSSTSSPARSYLRSSTRDLMSPQPRCSTRSPTRSFMSSPSRSIMRSSTRDLMSPQPRSFMGSPSRSIMRSSTRDPMSSPTRAPGADIAELEVLRGGRWDYVVLSFVGEGKFGRVARCQRVDTREPVAVKVLRWRQNIRSVAEREAAMLARLRPLDAELCNLVEWRDFFVHRGHVCFAFELLDVSLGAVLKQRHGNRLPLSAVRAVVQQVATALRALRRVGVIHADVKPDNVMMVDMRRWPFRLKLVDFGIAVAAAEVVHGATMQPLAYRAPEVLLGLPVTAAVDMWSLGCMAAAMFLGFRLHSGRCEYDVMRCIVDTQGMPQRHLLDAGQHSGRFFRWGRRRRHHGHHHGHQRGPRRPRGWAWRLKTPREYDAGTGVTDGSCKKTRRHRLRSLDAMLAFLESTDGGPPAGAELEDGRQFVDLVKRMLALDGERRISPAEVLRHPFVTLEHLAGEHAHTAYATDARQAMAVCGPSPRQPRHPTHRGVRAEG